MAKIWLTPWSNSLQKVHSQMTNLWLRLDQVFLVKVLSVVFARQNHRGIKVSQSMTQLNMSSQKWDKQL